MKKFISLVLIFIIPLSIFTRITLASTNKTCLEDMSLIKESHYTGNMGDSRVFNLNRNGLINDFGNYSANGNIAVDGTTCNNGFEVWLARWNFAREISFASATFSLGGKYNLLTGKTHLIKGSYNSSNFDITLYFFNGDELIDSYRILSSDYKHDISVDMQGVEELTIMLQDNVAVAGGTSIALYDMFLDNEYKASGSKDVDQYIINQVSKYTSDDIVNKYIDTVRSSIDYTQYAICDINEDGIPELIMTSPGWHPCSIYTYGDGEAIKISDYEIKYGVSKSKYKGLYFSTGGPGVITYVHMVMDNNTLIEDKHKTLNLVEIPDYSERSFGGRKISDEEFEMLRPQSSDVITFYSKTDYTALDNMVRQIMSKYSKKDITILLNGEKVEFDQPPIMAEGDRVLVPIRAVAEKMGCTVKWSSKYNSALIISPDRMVMFKNDYNDALVAKGIGDISKYYCDVPAQNVGGRTLTPIRAFAECLGAYVSWDNETKTASITYNPNIAQTLSEKDEIDFNAYYNAAVCNNIFESYTSDFVDFYNSRDNGVGDAIVMWWADWNSGVNSLMSGESNVVYELENHIKNVLARLPENSQWDIEEEAKLAKWIAEGLSHTGNLDFGILDKHFSSGSKTRLALKKLGDVLDKADIIVKCSSVGIDSMVKMFTDYTKSMEYINIMRDAAHNSSFSDENFYKAYIEALDNIEKDFNHKITSTIVSVAREGVVDIASGALDKFVTGGLFSVAEFTAWAYNNISGLNDRAEAIKNLHCIMCYNAILDESEKILVAQLGENTNKINDYKSIFDVQKAVKTIMYESMNILSDKSDAYTTSRISEQMQNINKMTYIIWE